MTRASINPLWLAIIPVTTITFACYLPALENGFVNWDDEAYIINNGHIRTLDGKFLLWAFSSLYASNWHPITWLSHAIDYQIWGLNPLGHHLSTILLHVINTILFMLIIWRLIIAYHLQHNTPSTPRKSGASKASNLDQGPLILAAAIAGLIFGLHPLHVESVAWLSERKDLLCATFFLASIICYLDYTQQSKRSFYALGILFFVLALMSKPMAVSLPLVLLIIDWHPLNRFTSSSAIKRLLIEKLPFIALSAASSMITLLAQQSSISPTDVIPVSTRIIVAFQSALLYLKKLIFPLELIPLYRYPQDASLLDVEYITPALVFILITTLFLRFRKKHPFLLAGWMYYLVTLLPVIGIVQVGNQAMADRYTYLPTLSIILILGLAASRVYSMSQQAAARYRRMATASVITAIIGINACYAGVTVQQIKVWKNGETLWTKVIQHQPDYAKPYLHRGNIYRVQQKWDLALQDFSMAISLAPLSNPNYYNDRGIIYARTGRFFEAAQDFQIATQLKPDNPIYKRNFQAAKADLMRNQ